MLLLQLLHRSPSSHHQPSLWGYPMGKQLLELGPYILIFLIISHVPPPCAGHVRVNELELIRLADAIDSLQCLRAAVVQAAAASLCHCFYCSSLVLGQVQEWHPSIMDIHKMILNSGSCERQQAVTGNTGLYIFDMKTIPTQNCVCLI